MPVLVINCGSSSIKYKLYGWGLENVLAGGIIEGVGGERPRHLHIAGDQEFEAVPEVRD